MKKLIVSLFPQIEIAFEQFLEDNKKYIYQVQDVSERKDCIETLKSRISEMERKLSGEKSTSKDARYRIAQAERENENLKKENENLAKEVKRLNRELDLQQQVRDLQAELNALKTKK